MFFKTHHRKKFHNRSDVNLRMQEVALWHNWKLSVKTGKENGKEEQQNGSFLTFPACF